jgi:hypothetical protein
VEVTARSPRDPVAAIHVLPRREPLGDIIIPLGTFHAHIGPQTTIKFRGTRISLGRSSQGGGRGMWHAWKGDKSVYGSGSKARRKETTRKSLATLAGVVRSDSTGSG